MTTEFDHLLAGNDSAPTAALAAVLQLAVEAVPLAQNVHDAAVTLIAGVIRMVAEIKNIPLTMEHSRQLAEGVVASLSATMVHGFLDGEIKSATLIGRTVNQLLDTIAAMRALNFIWAVGGYKELDASFVTTSAKEWVSRITIANDMRDACYRWPTPDEMAVEYFKARPSSPVMIRGAHGRRIHASYYFGEPDDTATSGMALLLLSRCRTLPTAPPPTIEASHV